MIPTPAPHGTGAPRGASGLGPPRALRAAGPALLVAVAFATLIWGLAIGGGAAPLVIADPGPVVRWGLPAAQLVVNLAAAGMVGSLVLALFALKAGEPEFDTALDTASIGAAVFTVAAGTTGFFTFVNAFNANPSADAVFGAQLGRFLLESELGRTWLLTTIAGAVLTVLTFAVRSWTPTLFIAILAIAALVPMATQGHSGAEENHTAAVMALVLHIIAAAVWLGGLILVIVVRPVVSRERIAVILTRYSSIALVAFVVVAISGFARATIGVGAWYRLRLIGKLGQDAAPGLGALRPFDKLRTTQAQEPRSDEASRRFWSLIALELAFMGIASGAAAALARTAPPGTSALPEIGSPAEVLTGAPLPPELTFER
ncbi:MAG TPA: copper transporter, partial [Microbacterium sp.]|uniref:copper resistance D family protein n=1 Tax=Microbacterium sp. TaxID=51671 RepID=UPI002CDCB330|nr:copper transporter [Microbacterium sp.]